MLRILRNKLSEYLFLKRLKKNKCVIHKTITFREKKYIQIGANVCLGEGTRLLCWSKYTSGKQPQALTPNLIIKDGVHSTRNLTIQCANKIVIEKDVLIASDVFIIDFNHGINPLTNNYLDNPLDCSEVIIKKGAWIGNGAIILPGVVIGEKSIVGAGSVVTKSVPPYSIAVGNPARVIKKYDFDIQKWVCV